MLAENQIDVDETETASSPGDDSAWAKANLRWQGDAPVPDMANALRILDGHPDFKGRFIYNETLGKVLDKGTLMLDWRVSECCAVIQERFVPGIAESTVNNALIICANRNGVRK